MQRNCADGYITQSSCSVCIVQSVAWLQQYLLKIQFPEFVSMQHAAICVDTDYIAWLQQRVGRTHRSESSMAAATGVGETHIVRRVSWLQQRV